MSHRRMKLADDLMEDLLEGSKKNTIRRGARAIETGPVVLEATNGTRQDIYAEISSVEIIPLSDISYSDLVYGGHGGDLETLKRTLRRFYPDILDEETMTVIRFSNVKEIG